MSHRSSGWIVAGIIGLVFATAAPATAQTPETAGFVADGATITGGALGSNIIVSTALNAIVADQIANGTLRTLMEIRDLQDPTAQNDPSVQVAVYVGLDQDGNAADDFSFAIEIGNATGRSAGTNGTL